MMRCKPRVRRHGHVCDLDNQPVGVLYWIVLCVVDGMETTSLLGRNFCTPTVTMVRRMGSPQTPSGAVE